MWRLPAAERALLFQAWMLLIATRIGLWIVPFPRVRARLDRFGSSGTAAGRLQLPAKRIAWAVRVTAQYVPGARRSCLVRSLVAHALLRRRGHPAELHLGVTRDPEDGFHAHAWVTCDDEILIGAREAEHFVPLVASADENPPGGARQTPEG